jgi:4-hydroxy-tetrahydrodipicolinate reductase
MLAQYIPAEQYDCEILERHHNKKKDAPSGTAMLLGQAVARGRNIKLEDNTIFNHNTGSAREYGKIGFASIRGGNIFGEHEVMFIGQNDSIAIKHTAYNRKLFAIGAVECALKLIQNKDTNGFFSPESLI